MNGNEGDKLEQGCIIASASIAIGILVFIIMATVMEGLR